MVSRTTTETTGQPSATEATAILEDTARAVKVMKASWLRVALNLRQIREHRLWRFSKPPCANYEEYVLGVLKLNKYVAHRMLQAMSYTEARRPDLIEGYLQRGEEIDLPSYDVVNQLRRAESTFQDREDDFHDLESRVWDDGIGRVTLKKEIDERLNPGGEPPSTSQASSKPAEAREEPPSLESVLATLRVVETQLLKLEVSKEIRQLAFRLVEAIQKAQKGSV